MKEFNTTGICVPSKHYMVDISERVREIAGMVEAGKYFVINRGRQYGKTTTIAALEKGLAKDYVVLSLDFQNISQAGFDNETAFVKAFSRIVIRAGKMTEIPQKVVQNLK
nr:9-O-acetyl-N-acetylneuraminate esterase [Lachnospiraceae bacterium]